MSNSIFIARTIIGDKMLNKTEFIQSMGVRRFGLFEYISELEQQGLPDKKIQARLLEDEIVIWRHKLVLAT